jgi:hypothetical protein
MLLHKLKAPENELVVMPAVKRADARQARFLLGRAGLVADFAQQDVTDTVVKEQSLEEGTVVRRGSTVKLEMEKTPPL